MSQWGWGEGQLIHRGHQMSRLHHISIALGELFVIGELSSKLWPWLIFMQAWISTNNVSHTDGFECLLSRKYCQYSQYKCTGMIHRQSVGLPLLFFILEDRERRDPECSYEDWTFNKNWWTVMKLWGAWAVFQSVGQPSHLGNLDRLPGPDLSQSPINHGWGISSLPGSAEFSCYEGWKRQHRVLRTDQQHRWQVVPDLSSGLEGCGENEKVPSSHPSTPHFCGH